MLFVSQPVWLANCLLQHASWAVKWSTSTGAVPANIFIKYSPLVVHFAAAAPNLVVSHKHLVSAICMQHDVEKLFGNRQVDIMTLAMSSSGIIRCLLQKYRALASGMRGDAQNADHWRRFCQKVTLPCFPVVLLVTACHGRFVSLPALLSNLMLLPPMKADPDAVSDMRAVLGKAYAGEASGGRHSRCGDEFAMVALGSSTHVVRDDKQREADLQDLEDFFSMDLHPEPAAAAQEDHIDDFFGNGVSLTELRKEPLDLSLSCSLCASIIFVI